MQVPARAGETETAFTWVDDGLLFIKNKGVASTAETMRAGLAHIRESYGEARRPTLIDARLIPDAEYGSWIEFVRSLASVANACAFLTSDATNLPGLGVYPDQIDRLVIPCRVFDETEEEDAISYLRSHMVIG